MTDEVSRDGSTTSSPKARNSALPRRRFFDDMPDKGLFGFVAVFGFGLITALKLYNYNSDLVAAIAVTLMVAYGAIAYRIPQVLLRLDRLGDNFYYLGFIYTLASLSAAIIQLREDPNVNAILGSFGIALVTTIVGVAGRVLFTQMRSEIDEVEDSIRRELISLSSDLKAQLHYSLREFETFHKSVQQVAHESLERIREATGGQNDRVADAAELAAQKISESFRHNGENAQKLARTIFDITESVNELTNRLSAIEIPADKIERQLTSIGIELERLLDRVSASLEKMTERLNAMKLPTARIEEVVSSFGAEIETRLLRRLAEIAEEVERTSRPRKWYWPFR